MITVFTPSFADESNTNAQNLTVKEVVARMDPDRFRITLLGSGIADPRIAARPNTQIIPWRERGNTPRILFELVTHAPDVYFFPREGQLDAGFLTLRRLLSLKTALVTYVISGGLENDDRPLLLRTIHESDVVVGNSRRIAETAEKLGGNDVQIVYDGIDRRYYFGPLENSSRPTGKTVLFAGSFRRYKRADLVVRQAAKHPEWEFRLAGIGEEQMACRQLARDTNCGNVRFLGHLNAAQLGEEMRRANLFFFPSEIEGHPQVLGQAAACGLPCIARNSYAPDSVVDGVTGLLADSDDELSGALGRLIGDTNLRARMSAAAVKHAQQFEWDTIAKQWEAIMEKARAVRQNHRRKRTC